MANQNQKDNQDNQKHNTQNTDSAKYKDQEKLNKSNGSSDTSQKDDGFDAGAFLELVKKYKRYIAAGVLFVAMVIVLVKCTGSQKTPTEPVQDEQTADQADLTEEFQVDAIPEINTLIADYYKAYQEGDIAALETLAQPISDTEKSYIKLFSEYVESYDNLKCYTKSGLGSGEYVVSVYLEMKFKGVETEAPGLDFFYVRTDESGKPYIDNAYSQFNQSNMENSTQADVQALINEFEQADDVVALQQQVQQEYDQAIESDSQLAAMANETLPNAISEWVQSLTQTDTDQTDQPAETDETKTDDNDDTNKSDQADDQTDENADDNTDKNSDKNTDKNTDTSDNTDASDENSDGKAKTAYALDGINLRKSPGTDAKVVTQISLGDKLKIYPDTKKDGWVKASYKKKKGYVKLEYVTTNKSDIKGSDTTENEPAKALPEGKEITLSDSVNVRVSMSETADRVGLAFKGDTVKVIQSYAEGWTKVEWNGQTGYIKTDLIK